MNDFTKIELGIIACNLCVNPQTKDILRKLESMINNYCEHESAKSINPGDAVLICNKCETILSHWNLRKFSYDNKWIIHE